MIGFVRDFISVGKSKLFMIIFGLGKGIIVARWLGPEKTGIIAALEVYPTLFIAFGSLGVSQAVTYFTGGDRHSEQELKSAISHIWVISTITSLFICFLLLYYFSSFSQDLTIIVLVILPIPFSLYNKYSSGFFLGKNQIKAFTYINWIPSFAIFLAVIVLVIILKLEIEGVLIASIFGPFFVYVILASKNNLFQYLKSKLNTTIIKSLLSLGIIYAISLLIINLNYKVDLIMLDNLSDSYNIGIYSKGASITEHLWKIPMLASTLVFARSAQSKDGLKFSYKVLQLLRISIIAIGIASVILLSFSTTLISFIYGSAFEESAIVLRLILPGVLLLTIFKVLNMDLAGKGKPWVALKAMLPALFINVILNLELIPRYGANGAAVASTISYTCASLLFLWLYTREINIRIPEVFYYSKNDFTPVFNALKKMKK